MTDVTKRDFNERLPEIKKAIDECTFLAIDTELTGLYSSKSTEHAFDTMQERYSKVVGLCSDFIVIQFGLSTFKYHPEQKKYTHRDFNFYVFPHQHSLQDVHDKLTFLCQPASLHYLASHNFDFNKVIYEGIPYLTHSSEEKIRERISVKYSTQRESFSASNSKSKANGSQVTTEIPDDQKEYMDNIHQQVEAFMSNDAEKELNLSVCNAYRRKLTYDTIQQKYPSGIQMATKTDSHNNRYICITKCSDAERMDSLSSKESAELEELDSAVGFRKVVEYISQSEKLVLGHHMYRDVLHTIQQFLFPLPEDLREFKAMCRLVFPRLLDTKHLAHSEKLKPFLESTSLEAIYTSLQGKAFDLPEIVPEEPLAGYELESQQLHMAGYDAFLTGVCFIGLSRKLGSVTHNVDHLDPKSRVLNSFVNRFYIFRHFDILSLNVSGPDAEPSRDFVFYVSFPKEWRTVDLVELFLPFGNIFVSWLNENSALVALKSKENATKAKATLLNKRSAIYQVKTYCEYYSSLSQKQTSIASSSTSELQSVSKRKSSSSVGISSACSMDKIPEIDENEAENIDDSDLRPFKKRKPVEEEKDATEVSSSAGVFEESDW